MSVTESASDREAGLGVERLLDVDDEIVALAVASHWPPAYDGVVSQRTASRISAAGDVADLALREDIRARAQQLGLLGWVRLEPDGTLCVHAEGERGAIDELAAFIGQVEGVESVATRQVKVEGHEQFAIRGVAGGRVRRPGASGDRAPLRRPARGRRSDAVLGGAEGPVDGPDGQTLRGRRSRTTTSPTTTSRGERGDGGVIIWDRGQYEQGGRVPWPEALDRGHAVFVLHGEKLARWLRAPADARRREAAVAADQAPRRIRRPGSDIVAERPESVHSGLTLTERIDG